MLDSRDKLEMKLTLARVEFFAESLNGADLIEFSRQLNDRLLFVRRRMAETSVEDRKVLRIPVSAVKMAQR